MTNGHGAPTHNIAINEACDFVSETHGVTMLHLTALFRADPAIQAIGTKITARHFSAVEIASFGFNGAVTMDARLADTIASPRLFALVASLLAGFALLISVVGLFGVLSYTVAQRREMRGLSSARR